LRQARGELIAYLGHDDLWLPHHLEAHVQAIDEFAAAMTYSLVLWLDPDDGQLWPATPRPQSGWWSPPTGTVHRRNVMDALGGWRDYREIALPPEIDLWRRARDEGFPFVFVPRLTAIKFPASMRRGVYRTRPSHEQAKWSARINSEPDLEATLLVRMIAEGRAAKSMSYRELVRQVIRETMIRLRRRLALVGLRPTRKGAAIDRVRRFKGL
jgi:hypothetical protein